jgi:hypothetical protein
VSFWEVGGDLVVAASQVLDERVTDGDCSRGVMSFAQRCDRSTVPIADRTEREPPAAKMAHLLVALRMPPFLPLQSPPIVEAPRLRPVRRIVNYRKGNHHGPTS